jgi:quinol monooxygenase YgiN
MSEVQVVARYTIAIGQEDEVMSLLQRLARATRAEPGCRSFEVYFEAGNARHLVLLERYLSREALAEHHESAHYRQLVLAGCAPRLDRRVVEAFDVPAEGAGVADAR